MSADTYVESYSELYDSNAVSIADFRTFIGAGELTSDAVLSRNLETAIDLLDHWLGARKVKIPANTYVSVLLGIGQQLYYANSRDTSTSGQYSQDGTFVTARPKDPMHYAYPILRKFVGWF
ncbi:hypothetical protein [Rhodococcoides fascians]|uniref:hypothetical protein n=1 Tax=Rhodococcoides fascians TaxID=1828 RepID=UPI0012D2B286|nr:hypothetical protein [Rhodococcus fascians]